MTLGFGEYYEDLKKWPSSGDYDNDPSQSGIQPETDQRTYNGHQWRIAQINKYTKTSGGLPVPANPAEVDQAVDAYSRAVYPLEYNWDWARPGEGEGRVRSCLCQKRRCPEEKKHLCLITLCQPPPERPGCPFERETEPHQGLTGSRPGNAPRASPAPGSPTLCCLPGHDFFPPVLAIINHLPNLQ